MLIDVRYGTVDWHTLGMSSALLIISLKIPMMTSPTSENVGLITIEGALAKARTVII